MCIAITVDQYEYNCYVMASAKDVFLSISSSITVEAVLHV